MEDAIELFEQAAPLMPELLDLGIAKSNRGYFPTQITHYRAPWAFSDIKHNAIVKLIFKTDFVTRTENKIKLCEIC